MHVELHSTSKIVKINVNGVDVPARIWEGKTAKGVPVHAFITRICPTVPEPVPAELSREFDTDLKQCEPPTEQIAAIPLRFIL